MDTAAINTTKSISKNDEKLKLRVVADSVEHAKQLIYDNLDEFYRLANRYCSKHLDAQDSRQSCFLYVLERIYRYNPKRQVKVSTFVCTYIKFYCLNKRRQDRQEAQQKQKYFENYQPYQTNCVQNVEDSDFGQFLIKKIRSRKHADILEKRLIAEKTFDEISRESNNKVSPATAYFIIKRFLSDVRESLTTKGLL